METRPIRYGHVVSFRVDDEQAVLAEHVRASFPNQSWAEMGRWMFDDPVIRQRLRDKIAEGGVERTVEVVLGD